VRCLRPPWQPQRRFPRAWARSIGSAALAYGFTFGADAEHVEYGLDWLKGFPIELAAFPPQTNILSVSRPASDPAVSTTLSRHLPHCIDNKDYIDAYEIWQRGQHR
jgi:hypothetical protein